MRQKHLYTARRKMCRAIDELYTLLLRAGSGEVDLRIRREAEGLRLLAAGDFAPEHRAELEGLAEALCPAVRNAALAEEFWELAGDDQYDGAGELALVGQMVDEARADVGETRVEIELYIRF